MSCAEYLTQSTDSKVKVKDHGKFAIFDNPDRKLLYTLPIDGKVLVGETAADYLVGRADLGEVIVELKGCRLDDACKQIERTLQAMKRCTRDQDRKQAKDKRKPKQRDQRKVAGLIVSSRCPSNDTKVQRLKAYFAKTYKSKLKVSSSTTTFAIEDFF